MKLADDDWEKVEAAMRRCKLSTPKPGDTELCLLAFSSNKKEYVRRKKLVDAQVHEEKRRGL